MSSEWTVVGGGAIGGTLGHALARAGHRVTIVDTDAEHVRAVADGGLRILRGEEGVPAVVTGAARTSDQTLDAERSVVPAPGQITQLSRAGGNCRT